MPNDDPPRDAPPEVAAPSPGPSASAPATPPTRATVPAGSALPDAPRPARRPLAEAAKDVRSARPRGRYAPPTRVLRVGRLLGKGVSVWLRNLVPFTITSLVCYSPLILLEAATTPRGVGPAETSLLSLFLTLAGWGFGFLAAGAMAYGTVSSLHGTPAPLGDCLTRGFRRLPTILGAALWILLYVVGASLVLGLLGLGVALVVGVLGFLEGTTVALFLAVLIQALPVALVLALFWVAIPAAVIEGLPARRALERSKSLTRGNFGPAFWTVAILLVVGSAVRVAAILAARSGFVVEDGGFLGPRQVPAFDRVLLTAIPLAAQVFLLGPITAVASAVSYHDLRVATEGVSADDLVRVFE